MTARDNNLLVMLINIQLDTSCGEKDNKGTTDRGKRTFL